MLKYKTKNNCILYIDCCIYCSDNIQKYIHNLRSDGVSVHNVINNTELNIDNIVNDTTKVKIILDDYVLSQIKYTTTVMSELHNIKENKKIKIVITQITACEHAYHRLKIINNISEIKIDKSLILFNLKKIQHIEEHIKLVQHLFNDKYNIVVLDVEVNSNNILILMDRLCEHNNIMIYYHTEFLKSFIDTIKHIKSEYKISQIVNLEVT